MDNIIYLQPLNKVLNYTPEFQNLLSQENSGTTYNDLLFKQLEEKKQKLLKEEKVFYGFFGVSSYKELKNSWAKIYADPNNLAFINDYKRITNSQITQEKELYEAISGQFIDFSSPRNIFSNPELKEIAKEEFLKTLSIFDIENNKEDYITNFGKNLLGRFGAKDYDIQIKNFGRVDFQEALMKEFTEKTGEKVSELLSKNLSNFFEDSFQGKKDFSFKAEDFSNSIFNIYADFFMEAFGSDGEIIFISKKKDTEFHLDINSLRREIIGRQGMPNITLGKELKEKILRRTSSTDDFSKTIKNPVPEFRTKQKKKYGKNWITKTVEDPTSRNFIKIKILDYITKDLKLTSSTSLSFFQNLSNEQLKQLLSAFTTSSGLIGYLGEIYGTLLFNLIFSSGKKTISNSEMSSIMKNTSAIAENIGGNAKKNLSLIEIDKWRKNYQPPVDILLTFLNQEKGTSFLVGVQSKSSYSDKAQKNHDVGFINPKPIERIFSEDLSEFYNANSQNQSFIQELKPLLELYYSNITIQELIKLNNKKNLSRKEKNAALGGVVEALEIIEKIFSYFIDNILDLGSYEIIDGDKVKERNLFYLYLNEYFIPASELIEWAQNTLKENSQQPSIVKVKSSKKEELNNVIEKDLKEGITEIDLEKNKNLAKNILDNILLSIDVNFRKENISKFSFMDIL